MVAGSAAVVSTPESVDDRESSRAKAGHRVGGRAVLLCAVAALLILALIAPVLAAFLALFIAVAAHRRGHAFVGVAATLAITTLYAVMNVRKEVRGDWSWYLDHYALLEHMALGDYLGRRIGSIVPEVTEPLYYAVAASLSRLTEANPSALAVGVTVLIYVPVGLAATIVAASYTRRPFAVFVSVCSAMLFGLTFTLSTQLIRQEIAAAFVTLGIALLVTKRRIAGLVVLFVAALFHNSALVPVLIAVGVLIITHWRRRVTVPMILILAVACFLGGAVFLAVSTSSFSKNDGAISPVVLAADLALVAWLVVWTRRTSQQGAPVVLSYVSVALLGFQAAVMVAPLLALRMYFYIEVVRALVVVLLVIRLAATRWSYAWLTALLAFGFAYLYLRVSFSPFDYHGSPLDFMMASWSVITASRM